MSRIDLRLRECSKELFTLALTKDKADNFARTFIAKANAQDIWDRCVGMFDDEGRLMGAEITTHSKRSPKIANLQLLHTFSAFRKQGVGKLLVEGSLHDAAVANCLYYRVSSEPESVEFYRRLGFKFWGKQKSGCSLSICRIPYLYHMDSIINAAVNSKKKGGCVLVYPEPV